MLFQAPRARAGDLARLGADLAALQMRWALVKLATKYSPDQPRVPAGNPDGGQWTEWVRVAANDRGAGGIATEENLHAESVIPKKPKGVDIESNIRQAERMRMILPPPVNLLWFYDQVHMAGPWDYKHQYGRPYADFGNFNFGATGAALGLSEDTLLRTAGWAQTRSGNSGEGIPSGLSAALAGFGGKSPFGDDPKDQDWIRRGIEYYRRKQGR